MLQIFASEHIEPLADRLADELARPSDDPFAPEWVAVPSVGIRRWLGLHLARRLGSSPGRFDGVAANVELPLPGALRAAVLRAHLGGDESDPWEVERLVWTVLVVCAENPEDPLLDHLNQPRHGVASYSVARAAADLFDRYHVHRPAMIRRWAAGAAEDAHGMPLPEHHRWQFHLWRLCRRSIAAPSPAERLPEALEDVRAGRITLDLPHRLAFFGLTQLPGGAGFVDVANALGSYHDLRLFLLQPSSTVSRFLAEHDGPATLPLPRNDQDAWSITNPLLRSWGRQHREAARVVSAAVKMGVLPRPDDLSIAEAEPITLLARLQSDIRADRQPDGSWDLDVADRSVQFHACFGDTRQVEAARDAILSLLADPDLELNEDDIVVICPRLEAFAPIIESVFGPSIDADRPTDERTGAPGLRYRIADRSVTSTNPVASALVDLVELLASRFEVADVLDVVASPPVRRCYDFDDDDIEQITAWAEATNVRWGIDPEQRTDFGVPATITSNTWQSGIDRMLMGSAVTDDGLNLAIGSIAPLGAGADDLGLAGRLAQLLGILGQARRATDSPRTVAAWIGWLRDLTIGLLAPPPQAAWQLDQVLGLLNQFQDQAASAGDLDITFNDLRRLIGHAEVQVGGRPDFFRGGITVTSLPPLRGIPYRVVCLVGLDQQSLAGGSPDGDDLLAAAPEMGDRDPRAEARAALLDAVLAARDHLIVVRNGHDVLTNAETPPSVVVAELMDAVSATVATPPGAPSVGQSLERDHPRHDYDESNFAAEGANSSPTSFDLEALAGAQARRLRRPRRPEPFLVLPLEDDSGDEIALDDLHAFLKHPVKSFLQRRLGLALPWDTEPVQPVVPVELDSLSRWKVAERLLAFRVDGHSSEEWEVMERALDTLPAGVLADQEVGDLRRSVGDIVGEATRRGLEPGGGHLHAIDVEIPDGTRIRGTVNCRLNDPEAGPCRVTYSRSKKAHHLAAWLDLVALSASEPDIAWRSVAIARAKRNESPPEVLELVMRAHATTGPRVALEALATVVALYRQGRRQPLPLFSEFSYDVQAGSARPTVWKGFNTGDGNDRANRLVFDQYTYGELMAIPSEPDDPGSGPLRVARLAGALWGAVEASTIDRLAPS